MTRISSAIPSTEGVAFTVKPFPVGTSPAAVTEKTIMPKPARSTDHSADIECALATEGGYLSIGRGGFTLQYRNGAVLSGYDCEAIKAHCIAAG